MRSVIVVPARYKSSRFPGKPLIQLNGKPMIIWVTELSSRAVGKENVYIATDDHRIADVVSEHGYTAVITSGYSLTGTDRVAELALERPMAFAIGDRQEPRVAKLDRRAGEHTAFGIDNNSSDEHASARGKSCKQEDEKPHVAHSVVTTC